MRGDTFSDTIVSKNYTFLPGDIIRIGVKREKSQKQYLLFQEITIERPTTEVPFIFKSEETSKLSAGDCWFEVEVTYNGDKVETPKQEKYKIVEDVVR